MSYSFINLAEDVLKGAPHPLTYKEIWALAKERGLDEKLQSKGATPESTLNALFSVEINHRANPRLIRVGARPHRYFLKSREQELKLEDVENIPSLDEKPVVKEKYYEKDLHPLLAYVVANIDEFFGEKQIYTKTIRHQTSRNNRKKALSEWLHPDMVGVYFPFGYLNESVIELGQALNADSIQVFSFELKKSINKGNYREYFFQAVSNSSWAHQSYLVAAEISEDDELRQELGRLTNAFGVGIIHLNISDIHSSRVIFDAKTRGNMDWDTVDKLCKVNKDFASFISRLNTDINAGQVHKFEYDLIIEDPIKYIREKLKIETVE